MTNYREIIDKIREKYLESNEQVLAALSGSLKLIQKMFPRYGSFLMEFIQNADDVGSSTIQIDLLDNSISIRNNGRGFSEADVKSICNIGQSSKSVLDYIGYLGIGFKSIFMISNAPEIYSDKFSFTFKKNDWPEPSKTPY